MGDSKHLSLGAGKLFWAPVGTAEPADLTTAWATPWAEIGYTEEGSELSYEISTEPVEVAEELEALFNKTTGRSGSVAFAMAENTIRNLSLAFNGGKVTKTGTAPNEVWTYEPPEIGEEVRVMLGFESEDKQERWIFRQVFQGGSVSVARRKGADKVTIPVEFRLEKVSGKRPFKAIYAGARAGGAVVTP